MKIETFKSGIDALTLEIYRITQKFPKPETWARQPDAPIFFIDTN